MPKECTSPPPPCHHRRSSSTAATMMICIRAVYAQKLKILPQFPSCLPVAVVHHALSSLPFHLSVHPPSLPTHLPPMSIATSLPDADKCESAFLLELHVGEIRQAACALQCQRQGVSPSPAQHALPLARRESVHPALAHAGCARCSSAHAR